MQRQHRKNTDVNKVKAFLKRRIVNTGNLKKDFQDPDLKSYGNKLPIVNEGVMKAGLAVQTVSQSPVVRKAETGAKIMGGEVKKKAVSVLKGYLKGTQKIADKIAKKIKK